MFLTRRQIRRLHVKAENAWNRGVQWEQGYKVSAPGGHTPERIAFDAGLAAFARGAQDKPHRTYPQRELPLLVWQQVLAEWMRGL